MTSRYVRCFAFQYLGIIFLWYVSPKIAFIISPVYHDVDGLFVETIFFFNLKYSLRFRVSLSSSLPRLGELRRCVLTFSCPSWASCPWIPGLVSHIKSGWVLRGERNMFSVGSYLPVVLQAWSTVYPTKYTQSVVVIFCHCNVISSFPFMWYIYPYSSGLLHCYWGKHMIAPVALKWSRRTWVKLSDTYPQLNTFY